ncbi:MAG: hypothetical protein ACC631_09490, partial [Halocynthiibacter sp.]
MNMSSSENNTDHLESGTRVTENADTCTQHWNSRFEKTDAEALTWFQDHLDVGLELIERYATPQHALIDV